MWGIRFIKEGKEFLAASGSGKVYRFEVATGTVLSSYKQSGTAYRIAVHPDGKRFVGTDSKNNATLWEIETGRLVRKFVGHTDDVYTAIIVNDGKTPYHRVRRCHRKAMESGIGRMSQDLEEQSHFWKCLHPRSFA